MSEPVIEIKGMKNCLGGQWVHTDVNLTVERGEILAIIGALEVAKPPYYAVC